MAGDINWVKKQARSSFLSGAEVRRAFHTKSDLSLF